MLWSTFIVSSILLAITLMVLWSERTRGFRHGATIRASLDEMASYSAERTKTAWISLLHFLERNVLLKGLHVVTYVALVQVRFAERKLMQLSQKLRSFRRDHHILRRSTHKLTQWTEELREGEER